MKQSYKQIHGIFAKSNAEEIRAFLKQFYISKFYNVFFSLFNYDELSEKENNYIKRRYWSDGRLAVFTLEGTKDSLNPESNGVMAFAPFSEFNYDMYDYPVDVMLINKRAVKGIPTTPQGVDKDVVIGYIQENHKSILEMITPSIEKIVEVDMTIRSHLKAHKVPFIVATTPENEAKMKRLAERIDSGEDFVFTGLEEINDLQVFQSGQSYIIDKLYSYKEQLINELLTFFGKNNNGCIEKKEHLITAEVDSNNEQIEDSTNAFKKCLDETSKRVKEILGYDNFTATFYKVDDSYEEDEEAEERE